MTKSNKRILAVFWLVAVIGLGIFLITLRAPKPPVPTGQEANAKKLVGSGHMAALYRIVWPSATMPKWTPHAEHVLIQALPWKGADKDSLAVALHDPSAKVELLQRKPFQNGLELADEVHDNAEHRDTFNTRWHPAKSSDKTTYLFSLSGGYVHLGWLIDSKSPESNGHSYEPSAFAISPQHYIDAHHDFVKFPNGTYERRVYVIAVS